MPDSQTQLPINLPDDLIPPEVCLSECDGNVFAIIGYVGREMRRAGNAPAAIKLYREQSMAGDYDHALRVAIAFTTVADR